LAVVAVVAEVAVEAFPDRVAVIVPAEKLPEASRWTIAEAVLAEAGVIHVGADVPFEEST
jgi:hypothetical protein